MKTKILASTLTLILLLSACAPATTPATTNTPVNVSAIRTATVGTLVTPVTQTAAAETVVAATQTAAAFTATPTPIPPTSGPGVAYDFVANAASAKWQSGAGKLAFSGKDGSADGFALPLKGIKMETGNTDPRSALLTVPQNKYDGYIEAFYPAFPVQSGDKFQATLGCQDGATDCYVTYRLDYHNSTGAHTFWDFSEKYDGQTYDVNLDLSALAGQNIEFFLLVLASGPVSGDRAVWIAPRITRVMPSQVVIASEPRILDDSGCWALDNDRRLLRTPDNGLTWYNVTPSGGYSALSFFLNANTGWVWTDFSQTAPGTLYRTGDGGQTWAQTAMPASIIRPLGIVSQPYLQFVDSAYGFALSGARMGMFKEAVVLFQTSDGGATWTYVCGDHLGSTVWCGLGGYKNGMYFQNALIGWIGGDSPAGIELYKTVNGGTVWAQQTLPIPAGYGIFDATTAAPLFFDATTTAPVFFNANDGILPVWARASSGYNLFIYSTHDGGASWSISTASVYQEYPGSGVHFDSPNDGFAYDASGAPLVTHNAGNSWSPSDE